VLAGSARKSTMSPLMHNPTSRFLSDFVSESTNRANAAFWSKI
jgi:hypothetical protein